MKKIYLFILSIYSVIGVHGQTLNDTNHSPVVGDMYTTWQCDSTAIVPGASGANASWNFSAITTHSSVVNNYTVLANSTNPYPIPGLEIASTINNISYYKATNTDIMYWGGNLSVGGLAATLTYTAPAVVASYPMSLNTSSSAVTGGSISIPALSQNGTFTGNSATIADGTGTIVTPSGTFNNAIRIITTQTINFTAPLGSGTVTQKNYDYYEAGVRNSLFTITTSTAIIGPPFSSTSSQTMVTRSNPNTVGIMENKQLVNDVVAYPNPATTNVNFTTESNEAKVIELQNISGKMIARREVVDGKLSFNISDYNSGLYFYKVLDTKGQTLKTGKITINH